jgi:hypothetical protein
MALCQSMVGDGCNEAGDGRDLVTAGGVDGDNEAEVVFCERVRRIDAEFRTQREEGAMVCSVRLPSIVAKREPDEEIYDGSRRSLVNWPLYTTETEDKRCDRDG